MSSALSAFHWRGQPSQFATDPKFASKQQGSAGMPAKDHPLRNATSSINTETPRIRRVKGAAI